MQVVQLPVVEYFDRGAIVAQDTGVGIRAQAVLGTDISWEYLDCVAWWLAQGSQAGIGLDSRITAETIDGRAASDG